MHRFVANKAYERTRRKKEAGDLREEHFTA